MKPKGFMPPNRNRPASLKKQLKNQLAEARDAKKAHGKSGQCEHPHTCGACHFWSGSIAALNKALGLPAGID